MVKYIKSDSIIKDIPKYDYTIIPTNCYCLFCDGFTKKVRMAYPYTYEYDKRTNYADKTKLGSILEVTYLNEPKFLICYVSYGYNFRPDLIKDYLDYEALETIIKKINLLYKGKKIASTLIGCNRFDGNGDRERVMDILNRNVTDFNLTVYDYFQRRYEDEEIEWFKITRFVKEIHQELSKYLVFTDKERKKKEKERKLKIEKYFKDNINNFSIKLI